MKGKFSFDGNSNFKFEKLRIWHLSMEFGEDLTELTKSWPKNEIYNLTSQTCRAVDSIALNIAEGSILQSKPEYRKFLGYSIRSLAEVVTCLYKARSRKYISPEDFEVYYQRSFELMNKTVAFRNAIK